jgi:hypothetical protein
MWRTNALVKMNQSPETNGPASWALALLNSLDPKDVRVFQDIGKPGSDKHFAAALTIQNIVQNGMKLAEAPRSSKPGPKPRHKRNQTDDDIATLWSCIRMILEFPCSMSVPSILAKLTEVFRLSQSYLQQNLLMTTKEADCIKRHLMVHGSLEELASEHGLRYWAHKCIPPTKAEDTPEENSNRSQIMDAAFVELARSIELHKVRLFQSDRVITHRDPNDGENYYLEFPDCNSLKELKLNRKELLWTALGKIFHLKTIFYETQFAWKPKDAEGWWRDIEYMSTPNRLRPRRSSQEYNEVIPQLLKRTIVAAALRQGTSPFSAFAFELASGFPPKLEPGIILKDTPH